ncbi:MAG: hypothetical protein ABL925_01265 [Methylococcales bacterium]
MKNKKILVTAVLSALSLNAIDAMAAFDITATVAPTPLSYAKELAFTSGVLTLTDAANIQDLTGAITTASSTVGASTGVQISVTLSNGAKFKTAPTMVNVTDKTSAAQSFNLVTGGAGSSTAVFQGNSGAGFDPSTSFAISVTDIDVVNTSPVSVTAEVSVANAINPSAPFVTTKTVPFITFDDALAFNCATGSPENVDVTKGSKLFTGSSPFRTSVHGTVPLAFTARYTKASALLANADAILASGTVKLTNANGWAAFNQTDGSVAITSAAANAVIAANDATVSYLTCLLAAFNAAKNVTLTVPAANTVVIGTGNITAAFTGVANTGYNAVTGSCDISPIAKNGSEDRLTFMLTPNGSYAGLFRVTNPSSIEGKVFLTVIDDAGVTASVVLTDLGLSSDNLTAGASTGLINVNTLGAAAKAKNAAFNASGVSKLRLVANGEFGTTGSSNGINLQALSVSKTGESFSMMQSK